MVGMIKGIGSYLNLKCLSTKHVSNRIQFELLKHKRLKNHINKPYVFLILLMYKCKLGYNIWFHETYYEQTYKIVNCN